jgi:hypothetical protein
MRLCSKETCPHVAAVCGPFKAEYAAGDPGYRPEMLLHQLAGASKVLNGIVVAS